MARKEIENEGSPPPYAVATSNPDPPPIPPPIPPLECSWCLKPVLPEMVRLSHHHVICDKHYDLYRLSLRLFVMEYPELSGGSITDVLQRAGPNFNSLDYLLSLHGTLSFISQITHFLLSR